MKKEMVEIIEYIKDGHVYKKTINGIEVPPEMLDPLPTVVIQKFYITYREAEKRYGKKFFN